MTKANIAEKDMQAFYDQNKSKFLAPEQVKAEFVVFRAIKGFLAVVAF